MNKHRSIVWLFVTLAVFCITLTASAASAQVAAINVSPDRGQPGSVVEVTGTGFPAYSFVKIEFSASSIGTVDVTPSPPPMVGPEGNVATAFVVPAGQAETASVVVTAGGVKAERNFFVLAPPTPAPTPAPDPAIGVHPSSGPPGSEVAVNGTGFPAYSFVRIELISSFTGTMDVTPSPRPMSDSAGNLTATFIVPEDTDDPVYVVVTAGGFSAGTTFSVDASPTPTPVPTPELTPTPSPVPTTVPTPTPSPVPTPVLTPVPAPIDTPAATPVGTTIPTPSPLPTATPEPTPGPTPLPDPVPTPAPSNETGNTPSATVWIIVGLVTAALPIGGTLLYYLRRRLEGTPKKKPPARMRRPRPR